LPALAIVVLLVTIHRPARADSPAPSSPLESQVQAEDGGTSPRRTVPDYDGRGAPLSGGNPALWLPRLVLSPLYLVTEYGLRRPLSVAIPAAEHADLPRKVYDFFTFGPEHKAGVFPVALAEFNFNPSVGIFAFWNDAGFKGDSMTLHAEAWPTGWVGGVFTQNMRIDKAHSVLISATGIRRPDKVFYGLGPSSVQSAQSRYGAQKIDVSGSYEWRFWRSSTIQTAIGVRDVTTYDGHYGGDPSLLQEAARGGFAVPVGFGGEYTAEYNRVEASLDSRVPASRLGRGVRLEVTGEQDNDVRNYPSAGWLRYGATAEGYVDLNGYGRILGLSVTTLFVDPLGDEPVPFTELVYLGGDHPMPGYYEGRLRDRSAATATLNYSWPIGPWIDGSLDLAVGNVFGAHLSGFDAGLLRFSGALGLSVAPCAMSSGPDCISRGFQSAPLEFLVGIGSETFDHGGQIDSVRVMFGVPHSF
jgi:hypothetical protein